MSSINSTRVTLKDKSRWDNLISESFNANYRAGMQYAYSRKSSSEGVSTFLFIRNDKDVAGAHYSLKKGFAGLFSIADIVSGMVFTHEPDNDLLSFIIRHFVSWAEGRGASFARIAPWLPSSINKVATPYARTVINCFLNNAFAPVSEQTGTYWVNLFPNEDDIIKRFSPGTRAKVRKAANSNIKTEVITKPGGEIVNTFWGLYQKLGMKKRFRLLNEERFKMEVNTLLNSGHAKLFVQYFNGIIINISLASCTGNATYYHGAVNPEYKDIKGCPAPGHYAQWFIITHMKEAGLKVYDMAFCPGDVPEKDHPDFDMWRFKHGFNGDYVQFLPSYGRSIKPVSGMFIKYWLSRNMKN